MPTKPLQKSWYAECKQFDGVFRPCVFYGEKPTGVRLDGTKYEIQNVHELDPPVLDRLSLKELYDHFNGVSDVAFKSVRNT